MTHDLVDPDRILASAYAPADRREGVGALFGLDEALGQALRGARDPLLAQVRLTWWHEALSDLGSGPVPADPALAALLTTRVVPSSVSGARLAGMIEGWEALLEEPIDAAVLERYAVGRGAALFAAGAMILGEDRDDLTGPAGAGWALVDLARHSSDASLAERALEAARPKLAVAMASRWPVRLRSLGALAALAMRDTKRGVGALQPAGHPARMLRALRHRLTGR
jgi:15-cis-phytoene synthase